MYVKTHGLGDTPVDTGAKAGIGLINISILVGVAVGLWWTLFREQKKRSFSRKRTRRRHIKKARIPR